MDGELNARLHGIGQQSLELGQVRCPPREQSRRSGQLTRHHQCGRRRCRVEMHITVHNTGLHHTARDT
ncbi:hypothetical protein ACH347_35820 [Saccharopolyspora sp. 5N102]